MPEHSISAPDGALAAVGGVTPLPPAEARALCRAAFAAYVLAQGREPRYNEFIRLVTPHGVSRTMARKAIAQLRKPAPQEEARPETVHNATAARREMMALQEPLPHVSCRVAVWRVSTRAHASEKNSGLESCVGFHLYCRTTLC